MNKCRQPLTDFNYRALYGKLFSSLVSRYGVDHVSEIEDAIQTSFLKSLKAHYSGSPPDDLENWLFIVARNHCLNQFKRTDRSYSGHVHVWSDPGSSSADDLRLDTLLVLASAKSVSRRAITVFLLKTVFGLSVDEISSSTLLSTDAIYKSNSRTRSRLKLELGDSTLNLIKPNIGNSEVNLVEEVLYSIFSIGFDSFSTEDGSIVNEDLCLEAIALARQLLIKYQQPSTSHLLALFCLHAARIPAKVVDAELIPFFNQDREFWNMKLLNLGFDYMKRDDSLNRFYLEALIASTYMTTDIFDERLWNELVTLYKLLSQYHPSPIITLNLCYVLHHAGHSEEARQRLSKIEGQLPEGHLYLCLVKAELLRATSPGKSQALLESVADRLHQPVRKEHIVGDNFIYIH